MTLGRPTVEADLDTIFSVALRLRDDGYRAVASLFLEGKPLSLSRGQYGGACKQEPFRQVPRPIRAQADGLVRCPVDPVGVRGTKARRDEVVGNPL